MFDLRIKDAFDRLPAAEFIYGHRRDWGLRKKKRHRKSRKPPDPKRLAIYNEYIHSAKWRSLKVAIVLKRGSICERCGLFGRVDLHHVTYARFGHERETDLQLLCRRCHKSAHPHNPFRK